MTAPCGGTATELDAPARRALERLARELPAGASTVVAPGRERVSCALDHATPGHDRQPHPGQTSRHTWADALCKTVGLADLGSNPTAATTCEMARRPGVPRCRSAGVTDGIRRPNACPIFTWDGPRTRQPGPL